MLGAAVGVGLGDGAGVGAGGTLGIFFSTELRSVGMGLDAIGLLQEQKIKAKHKSSEKEPIILFIKALPYATV